MKCITKGSKIIRVTDEKADQMVTEHGYEYCPKNIWKEKVRDLNKNQKGGK